MGQTDDSIQKKWRAAGIPYLAETNGDPEFLEWASNTRRGRLSGISTDIAFTSVDLVGSTIASSRCCVTTTVSTTTSEFPKLNFSVSGEGTADSPVLPCCPCTFFTVSRLRGTPMTKSFFVVSVSFGTGALLLLCAVLFASCICVIHVSSPKPTDYLSTPIHPNYPIVPKVGNVGSSETREQILNRELGPVNIQKQKESKDCFLTRARARRQATQRATYQHHSISYSVRPYVSPAIPAQTVPRPTYVEPTTRRPSEIDPSTCFDGSCALKNSANPRLAPPAPPHQHPQTNLFSIRLSNPIPTPPAIGEGLTMRTILSVLLCLVLCAPVIAQNESRLPDDSKAYELVVVAPTGSIVPTWFEQDAQLAKLKSRTKYTLLEPTSQLYQQRYATKISGIPPMVLLQRAGGGVVYACDRSTCPGTPGSLYADLKHHYELATAAKPAINQSHQSTI